MISRNSLPIPAAFTCKLICKHTQLHLPLAKSIGWFSALIFLVLSATFDTSDHSLFLATLLLWLCGMLLSILHTSRLFFPDCFMTFPSCPLKVWYLRGLVLSLLLCCLYKLFLGDLLHFPDSMISGPFLWALLFENRSCWTTVPDSPLSSHMLHDQNHCHHLLSKPSPPSTFSVLSWQDCIYPVT